MGEVFDYIVVGAGSTGCVVASAGFEQEDIDARILAQPRRDDAARAARADDDVIEEFLCHAALLAALLTVVRMAGKARERSPN